MAVFGFLLSHRFGRGKDIGCACDKQASQKRSGYQFHGCIVLITIRRRFIEKVAGEKKIKSGVILSYKNRGSEGETTKWPAAQVTQEKYLNSWFTLF
jgi:hypothetical protein